MLGLERPWYWDDFVRSVSHDHPMIYASAYTYRSTVWFDMVVPGSDEQAWLRSRGTELPETRTVEELALTAFERIDPPRVGA